jgi:uncharacterized protein (TIGR00299 family) protein
MKIAYFDCSSGISGDMCLGALVDAGISLKEIGKHLKKLPVKGYSLSERKVRRAGFSATKVDVVTKSGNRSQNKEARKWKDIRTIIQSSQLPDAIKQKSETIFRNLFKAESVAHGTSLSRVHLHEMGGLDCLVDIVGTLIGLELLGVRKIYASPVNLGGGSVKTSHGTLPVPAPATIELLKNVPVYSSGIPLELTTPTGAVILKSLSSGFGDMPGLVPETIGCGAGSRDSKSRPNLLRIIIGETYKTASDESVMVIETNIDDMNPQLYEHLFQKLFQEGALDVYITQVIMKKSRPGIIMSVLCKQEKKYPLIAVLLRETPSLGIRYHEFSRVTMDREIIKVKTPYGTVRLKKSYYGNTEKIAPEYEDCRKIAQKHGLPLINVIEEVKKYV